MFSPKNHRFKPLFILLVISLFLIKFFISEMNIRHFGGFLTDVAATILVVFSLKADCWHAYRANLPIYGNILVRVNLWNQCFDILDKKSEESDQVMRECEQFNIFVVPGKNSSHSVVKFNLKFSAK